MWIDKLLDCTVIVEYSIQKKGKENLDYPPGLIPVSESIEEEKSEQVDPELESFLMMRTFDNVKEFVKKAGKIF